MSAASEASAEAKMPQVEIVHDRVSKHLNEAVDKVRRTEHRRLKEEKRPSRDKFLLLWRRKTLTAGAVPRLGELLNRNLEVGPRCRLKEQFRHFWEKCQCADRFELFRAVYARAARWRLKPMIGAAKMLKRHLLNLLNYHHYRLTNAIAERIQRPGLPFLPKLPSPNPLLLWQTRSQSCLKSTENPEERFLSFLFLDFHTRSEFQRTGKNPSAGRYQAIFRVCGLDMSDLEYSTQWRNTPLNAGS